MTELLRGLWQGFRKLLRRPSDYSFAVLAWVFIASLFVFTAIAAFRRPSFPWELAATGTILAGAILTALGVSLSQERADQFRQRQSRFKELGELRHPIERDEVLHLEAMAADVLEALLDASFYGRLGLACIVAGSITLMIYQAFGK